MQIVTSRPRLIRHIIPLLRSTGFFAVVPVGLYGGLIVWSNDLGGPLNLVIIPAAAAIIGFVVSLVVFFPVSLLAERLSLRRSLQIVRGFLVALTIVVVLAWMLVVIAKPNKHCLVLFSLGVSLSLYLLSGFFVYLCGLAAGRRIS
jgi:hypothetical protein